MGMRDQASAGSERVKQAAVGNHPLAATVAGTAAASSQQVSEVGAALGRPRASVVICTVDRPKLLREAIASIVAQRYDGVIETLVVYDGTAPDTSLNVNDARRPVTVLRNTHRRGLPAGRNCGAEVATGEFLGFCDDDDTWLPDKTETQVALLERRPEVDAVVCGLLVDHLGTITERPLLTEAVTMGDLLDDRMMEVEFVTTMVRRDAFLDPDRLGGADGRSPAATPRTTSLYCAPRGAIRCPPPGPRWCARGGGEGRCLRNAGGRSTPPWGTCWSGSRSSLTIRGGMPACWASEHSLRLRRATASRPGG